MRERVRELTLAAAKLFGVQEDELDRIVVSRGKKEPYASARNAAMWLVREVDGLSYPSLGEEFDQRDHNTCLHGVRRAKELVLAGGPRWNRLEALRDRLRVEAVAGAVAGLPPLPAASLELDPEWVGNGEP